MTAKAYFSDVAGNASSVTAMFNPASLKMSVSNKLQDENAGASGNKGSKPSQNTRVTTTKLDVELTFDTTDMGSDVRFGENGTSLLRALATAPEGNNPKPPTVAFRWGNFAFQGLIESLNETLDFWSDEGVPLRSTIQLSMQQTETIDQGKSAATLNPNNKPQTLAPVPQYGTGTSGVGAMLGNAGAGRAIAAANGIENMRMSAGGSVAVSASVNLQAAASFSISAGASAGAGIGIGASAGIGIGASAGAGVSAGFGIGASASAGASAGIGAGASASAGFGIGASAGFGVSASAGASAGIGFSASAGASASASANLFGATATAGVSASSGAFAGLGSSKTTSITLGLDPVRLLPAPTVVMAGTTPRFDVTGRMIGGGSGFDAQLNARASASVAIV